MCSNSLGCLQSTVTPKLKLVKPMVTQKINKCEINLIMYNKKVINHLYKQVLCYLHYIVIDVFDSTVIKVFTIKI